MTITPNPDDYQPRRPLGIALIQEGMLSREEVEWALAAESKTGETLAEFVLRTRPADEEKVGRLLAQEWGLPFVAAAELRVDPRAVERLPLTVARDLEALPIGFTGGTLVVAIVQPRQSLFSRILEELGMTSFVVVPCSALESLLAQPSAASANAGMPATMPTKPLDTREAAPSSDRARAQAGPVQPGPCPATTDVVSTPVRPFAATAAVQEELRAARERMMQLGEELTRLRAVESALQAARELSLLTELQAELGNTREELSRLGAVERELRSAREELTRLREADVALRTAHEELARLQEELDARNAELEDGKRRFEPDIETLNRTTVAGVLLAIAGRNHPIR
jgi:hypothetical protein